MVTKHCGYELYLTADETRTNCTISFYRQRVEQVCNPVVGVVNFFLRQVIKVIKDHAVFRGFRGGTRMLHATMRLVVHATAVEMRLHPLYEQTCGPWKHW